MQDAVFVQDATDSLKYTLLRVVIFLLMAVKVNTLLFVAWYIIRRLLERPKPPPS